MEKALEFNHVSLIWPDFKIDDVTFSLEKGYIMGLVGYNGAGKTTLFRLMANQYRNYKGKIGIGILLINILITLIYLVELGLWICPEELS